MAQLCKIFDFQHSASYLGTEVSLQSIIQSLWNRLAILARWL